MINNLDDARGHIRRMKAVGAISVKSYNQPRRDQRQQILAAAREIGILVVPEGGSLFMHNMTMVVDGHTTVEHTIPVQNIYKDVMALWPPTKVAYTPTLLVGHDAVNAVLLAGRDYADVGGVGEAALGIEAVARQLRDQPDLRFEMCLGVSGVHYPQEIGRELPRLRRRDDVVGNGRHGRGFRGRRGFSRD